MISVLLAIKKKKKFNRGLCRGHFNKVNSVGNSNLVVTVESLTENLKKKPCQQVSWN